MTATRSPTTPAGRCLARASFVARRATPRTRATTVTRSPTTSAPVASARIAIASLSARPLKTVCFGASGARARPTCASITCAREPFLSPRAPSGPTCRAAIGRSSSVVPVAGRACRCRPSRGAAIRRSPSSTATTTTRRPTTRAGSTLTLASTGSGPPVRSLREPMSRRYWRGEPWGGSRRASQPVNPPFHKDDARALATTAKSSERRTKAAKPAPVA